MSKQDGSIARLDSCAVRLNSVCDVRNIARKMIKYQFSWFDYCDPLIVEGVFPEVCVFYVSTKTSNLEHRTFVDCRFHFDCRQMWIGFLEVAACHRLQGVGRQLVRAAEATADALGMEEVRILPVPSSVDFWLKLDYTPDPRSARVFWKNPAGCHRESGQGEFVVHADPKHNKESGWKKPQPRRRVYAVPTEATSDGCH